jgi:uncharacterized protein (DUF305 family)
MEKNKKLMLGAGALIVLLLAGGAAAHYHRSKERNEGWGKYGDDNRGGMDDRNHMMNGANGPGNMDGMHDGMMNNGTISERQFIEMMIPHHEEAIATAKIEVAKGENADAKKLAADIITAQEKEVADMKSWYKNWYGVDYQSDGTYKNMMPDLSKLSGNKLDRAFLEGMIEHHTGALEENQLVVPNITHGEIQTLAQNIAQTQSSEIITMRILLKQI